MKKKWLIFGIFIPLALTTSQVNAGSFGAEIFCTMRDGGNDHESSWDAAYTYIKKQKGGIFKVSPKQAASQITESVIRDQETFSYCVEYLDKLHPNRKLLRDIETFSYCVEYIDKLHPNRKLLRELKKEEERREKELEESNEEFSDETIERYSY